jgi:hypothetical protein
VQLPLILFQPPWGPAPRLLRAFVNARMPDDFKVSGCIPQSINSRELGSRRTASDASSAKDHCLAVNLQRGIGRSGQSRQDLGAESQKADQAQVRG